MSDTPKAQPMSHEAMLAEIKRLREQNAALQAHANRPQTLTLKVSEKGAVSVYGLGRFPVTLYAQQWERLLTPENINRIGKFVSDNAAKLSVK